MPQDFCTLRAVPEIFSLINAGTTTSIVRLAASGRLVWADASFDLLIPGTTKIFSAYPDGLTTKKIDTSVQTWLLMAIKGGSPLLMLESDLLSNVETVLAGANWAILRGVDASIYPYPPV